ncbi:MAG: DNA mismatch repair endonuclease MutL [Clostridiales bacterium]|nr:DNA mismatch repair endonuclease MutL [Clostridiales bacterium]
MAKITVLSREVSELIAAGEVIERPASVIKELVENSIDAGANHITVEIKNGGTTYMKIVDNGCGISKDDIETAFLRHATSKVNSKSDLDNIETLGFRGEALASIAAVSRVEVLSKQVSDKFGVNYKIEGSVEKLNQQTGCPDGTTIIIRDLFYNVPARQKFMKKDVTEANAISFILQKIALSHPEVAIKMIRDNKLDFNSTGDGSLYSAIYSIYGKNFAHDLIEVDYQENGVSINGYTVKPLYSRHNRSFQNFFVNGRYIKSLTCSIALEEAYKSLIMVGRFPACVLKIDVHPSIIDVNVHPAKIEVRFSNEKLIFNSIYFAIKNALMKSGLIYEFQMKKKSDWLSKEDEQEDFQQQTLAQTPAAREQIQVSYEETASKKRVNESVIIMPTVEEFDEFENKKNIEAPEHTVNTQNKDIGQEDNIEGFKYISSHSLEQSKEEDIKTDIQIEKPKPILRIVGEAFLNYVLAEVEDNIIIIDKHAAHERVIYENLKTEGDNAESQFLITPCKVLLSLKEYDAMLGSNKELERMGFKLDFDNKPYVYTIAIPTYLEKLDMDEVIPEIAQNLYMNKINPQTNLLDEMFHTLACKAAIKANDKNSIEELKSLAEQVYFNENIRHCPHGRPIMFSLSKREMEKQFKRG